MFATAKIVDSITRPDNLLLIVLTLGFLHMLVRSVRPGRLLIGVAVISGWILAVTPVPGLMLRALEARIPAPPSLPAEPEGLILLGGMILPDRSESLDQPVFGTSASRMTGFLPVVETYPNAASLFSGAQDAAFVERYLLSVGVAPERLMIENKARTTHENALYSHALASPETERDWLLITSAYHMPRALAAFRKVGWDVTPVPVGRKTPSGAIGWRFDLIDGLKDARAATHEYVGLVWYWWRGDIDELWPTP